MRAIKFLLYCVSLFITTSANAAEMKLITTEILHSKILPHRLTGLIVSPNGKRVAYLVGSGRFSEDFGNGYGDSDWEKTSVVIDSKKERAYDGFVLNPTFSPDSQRVAYVAWLNSSQILVLNNQVINSSRGINKFQFSPDSNSIAYIAESNADNTESVFVNNIKQADYEVIDGLRFSPDSNKIAYSARPQYYGNDAFVVVNEKQGNSYSGIGVSSVDLIFSPDSKKLAYVAQKNSDKPNERSKCFLVVDEHPIDYCPNAIIYSPDSLRLALRTRNGLVLDGRQIDNYNAWSLSTPIFSPDSKQVVFAVSPPPDNEKNDPTTQEFIVLNGKEGKKYQRIGSIFRKGMIFSPNSEKFAYMASSHGKWFVVLNEKEGKPHGFVSEITFSPDSKKLAYVGHTGNQFELSSAYLVMDGVQSKKYENVDDLLFSSNSENFAYVARKKNKSFVVINGTEGKSYDFILTANLKEEKYHSYDVQTSSLIFDSNKKLRYLAIRGNKLYSVETTISKK